MLKKYIKMFTVMCFVILAVFLVACGPDVPPQPPGPTVCPEGTCVEGEWVDVSERICGKRVSQTKSCTVCGTLLDERQVTVKHEYVTEIIEATCTQDGKIIETCKNCDKEPYESIIRATGHVNTEFRIVEEAEKDGIGTKELYCKEIIKKHSKDFNGTLEDPDVIKLCGCSKNSYYKYKKELKTI